MKLTFIPAPGSPCRVVLADDPQPEESWSARATDKRIAPPVGPTTQAVEPRSAASARMKFTSAALSTNVGSL